MTSQPRQPRVPPAAFEAFEDIAAYVTADLSRAQAITEAREASSMLADDYRRKDLRVSRVFMRPVIGGEAEEFFYGEFDSGWMECTKDVPNAFPMWKVAPK